MILITNVINSDNKFKNLKKILFLGSFVKNTNTGGSVGIDFILKQLLVEKVIWLNTRPKLNFRSLKDNLNVYEDKKNEPLLNNLLNFIVWNFDFYFLRRIIFSKKIPSFISHIFLLFHLKIWSKLQMLFVIKYIKKNEINYCFVSLDNDFIIFSYTFLCNYKKTKNISIVSDDPYASLKMYGVDNRTCEYIQNLFLKALKDSSKVAVISEGMQLYYKNLADIDSIITYPVNATRLLKKNELKKPFDNQLQIIHIGHLRNSEVENLNIFLNALNHSGIDYTFIFLGRDAERYNMVNHNKNLKILGWVSQIELENYISSSNFAYVPYSFNIEQENFVSTSFPNKVTSFLKSGIPIIHHGPIKSTVSKFINKYKVGFNINSLNINDIKYDIQEIYKYVDISNMKYQCLEVATLELDSFLIANKYNEMIND